MLVNAFIALAAAQGVSYQWRTTAGGTSANSQTTGLSAPYWVRLRRVGNQFTGYRSPDGHTWTQQSSVSIAMSATVYLGFAVTSHDNSQLTTYTFDRVSTDPCCVWVQVPELRAGTYIWAHWGNPAIKTSVIARPTLIDGCQVWLAADALSLANNAPVASWTDSSGNGQDATQATSAEQPTYATGAVNGKPAVYFDGTAKRLFGPDVDVTARELFIVCQVDATAPGLAGVFCQKTSQDRQNVRNNTATTWRAPGANADGNDFVKTDGAVFVNGAASNVHNNQFHILENQALLDQVFRYQLGQTAYSRYFKGYVAEVIIYDRILTAAERNKVGHYLAAKYAISAPDYLTPPEFVNPPDYALDGSTWGGADYEAVWHLKEPNALDSAANDHDGTGFGNVDANGCIAGAQSFNNGQSISVPPGIDIRNQSFTFRTWARHSATGDNDFIAGQGTGGTDNMLHIGFRNTDVFAFAFYSDDLNIAGPWTDTTEWHHWSCVYNAATKRQEVFRDGVSIGSRLANNHLQATGAFIIGANGTSGSNYRGQLDEMRLANTVRSQDWITAEYENERPAGVFTTLDAIAVRPASVFIFR